jgi:large subunit ribosomal protein L23
MNTKEIENSNNIIHKRDLTEVLRSARITEKASKVSEGGVYVFNVAGWANKNEIKSAVKKFYKVTPIDIHTTKIPSKKVFRRGHHGVKKGGKKAYITLKKGDKIELA